MVVIKVLKPLLVPFLLLSPLNRTPWWASGGNVCGMGIVGPPPPAVWPAKGQQGHICDLLAFLHTVVRLKSGGWRAKDLAFFLMNQNQLSQVK